MVDFNKHVQANRIANLVKANKWWDELHPINKQAFTIDENPTQGQILAYWTRNELNNPTNQSSKGAT